MSRRRRILRALVLVLASAGSVVSCGRTPKVPAIVIPDEASGVERFAAAELRRYFYLRTGALASIEEKQRPGETAGFSVVVGIDEGEGKLGPEEYILKTVDREGTRSVRITAGGGPGLLYGTYRFLNTLGFAFGLEGDVVPDEQAVSLELPDLDERGRPLFAVRGIQPFHDFPEGPDWWSLDHYKAVLAQLPKLGMNFFGLHTYPEGGPGAEPTVWIGEKRDHDPDGRVGFSYPSSYATPPNRTTMGMMSWKASPPSRKRPAIPTRLSTGRPGSSATPSGSPVRSA